MSLGSSGIFDKNCSNKNLKSSMEHSIRIDLSICRWATLICVRLGLGFDNIKVLVCKVSIKQHAGSL